MPWHSLQFRWSVAGLDALFCVSFGRPSSITFYTTNLPQDRTDDNLSDAPGSAQAALPPSNVLRNETTDMSYHAAYYQLTIPSLELLDRVFRTDWEYSRSAIYGWFSRTPESEATALRGKDEQTMHTYEDAVRLASDIFQWYSHIPRGMRFEPEEDTAESFSRTRTPLRINQTLALCVKTFMLVYVTVSADDPRWVADHQNGFTSAVFASGPRRVPRIHRDLLSICQAHPRSVQYRIPHKSQHLLVLVDNVFQGEFEDYSASTSGLIVGISRRRGLCFLGDSPTEYGACHQLPRKSARGDCDIRRSHIELEYRSSGPS